MIKKEGVFMSDGEKIRYYGDEMEVLEGDFYKPETPASPFYRSQFSIMKIKNKTG